MNQYQYEVGDFACGRGFPPEMHWLWTSDDGDTQACGKKYKRLAEAGKSQYIKNCFFRYH